MKKLLRNFFIAIVSQVKSQKRLLLLTYALFSLLTFSFSQPSISVAPGSFSVTISSCNDSVTQPFAVNNTGSSNLLWDINLRPSPVNANFYDGFESGNIATWTIEPGTYTRTVTTTSPANGTYCLQLDAIAVTGPYEGVSHTFLSDTPDHFSFKIKSGGGTGQWPCAVEIGRASDIISTGSMFEIWMDNLASTLEIWTPSNYIVLPAVIGQWYKVDIRNINYTAKTFDYFVNDSLVGAGIIFWNLGINAVDIIHLFAWDINTTSFFDEIILGDNPFPWLIPSPLTGTTVPSGSSPVNVKFRSTFVLGGTHYGEMVLTSNDPANSEIFVPCVLTVNGPVNIDIPLGVPCPKFDTIMVGDNDVDTIQINNLDCGQLTISNVTSSSSEFTVVSYPPAIAPYSSGQLLVSFSPTSTGNKTTTITVFNNDADTAFCLQGVALPAPTITVSPALFNVAVACGDSLLDTLVIGNIGGGNLNWNGQVTGFSGQSPSGYCTPSYSNLCSSADYIENFTFNTLSKLNSGCNGQPNNYIYDQSVTTTVQQGGIYSMSMQSGASWAQGFGVWIDYNRDGDYDDAGEFIYASPTWSTSTFTTTVTIPSNASGGKTRLRVRCRYTSTVAANEYCSLLTWGECEEYEITIGSLGVIINPTSGTVIPSGSQNVQVEFDSKGLLMGTYTYTITINSNDPVTPVVNVPCTLNVVGAADFELFALGDTIAPLCLDLDSIMAYTTSTDTIIITNVGCDTLWLDSLKYSPSVFSTDTSSSFILPGDTGGVVVLFSPVAAGNYSGSVNIYTNDLDTIICLYGEAFPNPVIDVVPDSFNVSVACGDSLTDTLFIYNNGGSILNWNLYTGTTISDDFDPGIDGTVWSVNNGILSTNCGTMSGNALFFDNGGVRQAATIDMNTLGGGTIDFAIRLGSGGSCEYLDPGEDVVLEYSNNGGGSWTNIMTFWSGSFSVFTPLSAPIPPGAQTLSTRFRWRQLSHSGTCCDHWALDNISISILGNCGAFLCVNPTSGSTSPSGIDTVFVTFNTTGLLVGQYITSITILSNDPLNNPVIVPCTLNVVGAADFQFIGLGDTIAPLCLDLDSIMAYTTSTDTIILTNVGCDTLWLDSLKYSPSVFSTDTSSPFILPGDTGGVVVLFSPVAAGNYSGSVNIYTNDLDTVICLYGESYPRPIICSDTDTLNVTLTCCDSTTVPLGICNSGGSDLYVSVSLDTCPPPLWRDDFEDGDYVGWTTGTCGYTYSVITTGAPQGNNYLRISNACGTHYQGLRRNFGTSTPQYMSYWVRVPSVSGVASGYFVVGQNPSASTSNQMAFCYFPGNGTMTLAGPSVSTPVVVNQWYQVEFKNINYSTQRFDWYVNGSLVSANVSFRGTNITNDEVHIYNYNGTFSEYDEIIIADCSASAVPWINIFPNPILDTIISGDTAYHNVNFNSCGLLIGQYTVTIAISSNDPLNPVLQIPCTLNIVGAADFQFAGLGDTIAPLCLDLDSIMEFTTSTDTIFITNIGCDTLWLDSLKFSPSVFSTDTSSPFILPGDTGGVVVLFSPVAAGNYSGSVNIYTNDLDTVICLYGEAFPRPIICWDPDTFNVTLGCSDSITIPWIICNSGGSDLIWNIDGAGSQKPRVLLICNDGNGSSVETELISTGKFTASDVDILNSPPSITMAQLAPYDAVLIWTNTTFNASIGDTLKKFVDNGGGVVLGTYDFSSPWALSGGIMGPAYSPFTPSGTQCVSGTLNLATLTNPNHPIFQNISVNPTYWWNCNYSNPPLTPGATLLASDMSGYRVVAEQHNGQVVGIVVYPGNLSSGNASVKMMFANALYYVNGIQWINLNPSADTTAAGDTTIVNIEFNSTGLLTGQYTGNLTILSNDPLNGTIQVPCTLNVVGTADFELFALGDTIAPLCLDLDSIMEYTTSLDSVGITNLGCDTLWMDSLVISPSVFSITGNNPFILPGDSGGIVVQFAPLSAGSFNGTLNIYTNDLDTVICLYGESYPRPIQCHNPNSFNIYFTICQDSITDTLNVCNTGASNLNYSLWTPAGRSATFDGSGDYINRNVTNLPTGSVMTVEAWIYPVSYPDPTYSGIVSFGGRFCNGNAMVLSIQNNGRPSMATWCWDFVPATGPTATLNQWNHIACVMNGTSVTLYMNGTPISGTLAGMPSVDANNLAIGATDYPGRYFNGKIDEVRIYNKALSQAEIFAGMYNTLSGNETGLMGYWNFDNGTANDLTVNANHGTLNGNAAITTPNAAFIPVSAAIGTVAPSGNNVVPVKFKKAGLPFGTTIFPIYLTSNDPLNAIDTISVTFTVDSIAPAAPVANDTNVCFGNPTPPLIVPGNPVDTIKWYNTSWVLQFIGDTFNTGQVAVGTYTYYVTKTDTANGCESQADTVLLTINSAPSEPTANDTASCFGFPTPALTSTGTLPQWYTSLPPATPVFTGSPFNTGQTAAGTYTYYVTDSTGGCPESVPDTVMLSIYALPNTPVANDTAVCFGGPIPPLTATVTGTDSIRWYNTSMVFQASGDTFYHGQTAAGTYIYYVTSVDTVTGCESVRDTAILTINNTPPPAANNVSSCFGSPTPDLIAAPNNNIQWYDNTLTLVSTNDTFATGQTAVGTYTYYVTQTLNGCESNYDTVLLTINPIPAAPPASDVQSCFGSPTPPLTATGSNIQWYNNPTLSPVIFSGSPYNTGQTAVGTYTYYVTQTVAGCLSAPDTVYLTIYALPVKPLGIDTFVCFGNPTPDLIATGITGNDTVKWYNSPALSPVLFTGNPYATGQTAVGTYTYYVTQTDTLTGCRSLADTVFLSINAAPVEPTANDVTVCFGFPVPPLTSTGNIIQWYNNPALNPVLYTGSPYNTGQTAVGAYTYYVTDSVPGCPQSPADTALLTINPIPVAPVVSNDTAICFGSPTPDLLSNIVNTNWFNSSWTLVFTGDTFATGLTAAGSYTFYATQTVAGCQSSADTVVLTINFTPAVSGNDTAIAFGSPTPDLIVSGSNITWYDTNMVIVSTNDTFATGQTAVGVYTYYVSQTLNGCESALDTVVLTIYPAAPAAPDVQSCFGQPVPDLTASGSGTIEWFDDAALTNLVFTGSPFPTGQTNVGTYTYYVTQTINNVQSPSDTVYLTINAIPPAPVSSNQTACFNEIIPDLTATGTNIQWYDDAALTNLVGTGSPFATGQTAANTYTYYVTQTVNGCESPSDTVTLTINPQPSVPLSNDTAICFGDPVPDLTATGTNIQWYDDAALTNLVGTGSPFATGQTAAGTYTYYVTQTDGVTGCESNADTVMLAINLTPVPLANDVLSCFGNPVPPFTAAGTNVQWYDTSLTVVATGNSFSTGQTAVGTYTYFVTQTLNGCESVLDTVLLVISTAPSSAPTVADTASCFNQPTPDLIATTGTIINWYDNPSLATPVFVGNPFVTGQTAVNTYTYYVTDSFPGCPEGPADTVILTINSLPAPPLANDTAVCSGSPTPDLIAVGTNIIWYDTSLTIVSTNDTFATGQTAVNTYTYYVTQTSSVTGCESNPDTVLLTINSLPAMPLASDTTVCSALPIPNLTSTGANPQWYDTSWTFLFAGSSFATGQTAAGTYIYYVTDLDISTGCESAPDTSALTILLTPPVPVANNVAVCFGNPVPSLTSTGNSPHWYTDAALTNLVNIGNSYNTGQTAVNTYTYYVTDSLPGCMSAADTVLLTINTLPAEPNSNDTTICYGNPAVLTSTGGNPQWYNDPSLIVLIGTGNNFNTGQTAVGIYTYYVTDYAAGCGNSSADTATLTINPSPLVTANTYSVVINQGGSATLTAYNAQTYSWAPPAGLNTTTGQTVIASPTVTTTYTVTGTNQYNCSNDTTVLVVVNPTGVPLVSSPIENLNIYPNPAVTEFYIVFTTTIESPVVLYLFNTLGEKVLALQSQGQNVPGVKEHKITVDARTFTEGVYHLEIVTGQGTVNRRVVVFR